MQATRLAFALLFGALLIGTCMCDRAKRRSARRHDARTVLESDCGYVCNDGSCIPSYWECDAYVDCAGGEDEADCPEPTPFIYPPTPDYGCSPGDFHCDDGMCIPASWECDYIKDCMNEEDEDHCPPPTCNPGEFVCDDGMCIPASWECDYIQDCKNNEDEDHCPESTPFIYPPTPDYGCSPGDFHCDDGMCIPASWECDDIKDCMNDEDEAHCPEQSFSTGCYPWEFQCYDGLCIPDSWECNNYDDCSYGEDEYSCDSFYPPPYSSVSSCGPEQLHCLYSDQCISYYDLCNGKNDCINGEDEDPEITCAYGPPPPPYGGGDTFTCMATGDTIPQRYTCDRIVDCPYAEDEWMECGFVPGMKKRDMSSKKGAPARKSMRHARRFAQRKRAERK